MQLCNLLVKTSFFPSKEQLDILTRDDRIGINCSNWLAFGGETLTDNDKIKHQVS